MAQLEYDEIKERKYIVLDGQPWEVLTSHVFRKQQRKPVNAVKLRNLISGKVTERSFHVSEKAEEAEIENRDVKYLYENKGEYWFCDPTNPSDRYKIDSDLIGQEIKYIKQNSILTGLVFDDEFIGIKFPIKVDLKVTEAHDAVKGNTSSGATKQVVVETGATVNVPMFIKEGEIIRINTETGNYAERVGGNNF
ncbi:MAG: elongation factor P [bacterium]